MDAVEEKIAVCFDGLRNSEFPPAWVSGGPRSEDITIILDLPISEVDGGGVEPLDELEKVTKQELPAFVTDEARFNIASAFVLRTPNTLKDAYEYRVTLSVNV